MNNEGEAVDYYILFPNHHEGLNLLKAMREAGVACSVSPTPRCASTSCGISLRVSQEHIDEARSVISKIGVVILDIVALPKNWATGNRTC